MSSKISAPIHRKTHHPMAQQNQADSVGVPFWRVHRRDLLLTAFFVAAFVIASLLVHPINVVDYSTFTGGIKAAWQGRSPYSMTGFFMPPWSLIPMTPLTLLPVEVWLALDVAIAATMILDLGTWPGLLLLFHPAFITLIASANAEWLLIGPGLWLLYRARRGWGRGLAWLLLTCQPPALLILLILDGWDALRTRDWKAFALAAPVALVRVAIYPDFFQRIRVPLDWSLSVISHFGVIGAVLVTLVILALRWGRLPERKTPRLLLAQLRDLRTLGLMLNPGGTTHLLPYKFTA